MNLTPEQMNEFVAKAIGWTTAVDDNGRECWLMAPPYDIIPIYELNFAENPECLSDCVAAAKFHWVWDSKDRELEWEDSTGQWHLIQNLDLQAALVRAVAEAAEITNT